jgi:crossover junction endodeoxyribonuclease RusA
MNPTGPFVLTLKFIPPANRHYDLDNLIARMKSPLDGVAQALSTDDRRFRFGEITLEPAQKPGKVIVTIQESA